MLKKILISALFISFIMQLYSQDITPPDTPILDSISVNNYTRCVSMSWTLSTAPDVYGYIIYRKKGIDWIPIDTAWGKNTNTFEDCSGNAYATTEQYRVAAFDTSFNRSPMTNPHQTMLVNAQVGQCLHPTIISWSNYIGWSSGVEHYLVYVSQNSGSYILLTSLNGNINSYYHSNLALNTEYCYYVRAVSNTGKTSSSNKICVTTSMSSPPKILNADYATVTNYNEVSLSFSVDTTANISKYKLLKANSAWGHYDTIACFQTNLTTPITYTDVLNTNYISAYYKLVATNECNINVLESNIASNMVLKVTANNDATNTLVWNPYYNWKGGCIGYRIYRGIDNALPELLTSINSSKPIFIDDVSAFVQKPVRGIFCYYVEAIEGLTNPYGIQSTSISNIAYASQDPIVYMPEIFTPNNDGINDTLKPIVSFASPNDYLFTIFSRWGDIVFETHVISEGWDGKYNGNLAKSGMYGYYIKFSTSKNEVYKKNGMIILER